MSLSTLPQCGQTCVNNMIQVAESQLGCASGNVTCYCTNGNFGYGVRDCANEACDENDAQKTISYGTSYCAGALSSGSNESSTTAILSFTSSSALATSLDTTTSSAPGTSSDATSSSTPAISLSTISSTSNTGSPTPVSTATASSSVHAATVSGSRLTTGAKAGIGIGVAIAAMSLAGLMFFFIHRHRRKHRKMQLSGDEQAAKPQSHPYELYAGARHEKDGTAIIGELSTKANTHEMAQPPVELDATQGRGAS